MSFKVNSRLIQDVLTKVEHSHKPHLVDPGFAHHPRRYLVQASAAVLAMMVILAFTDSISDAALAAALGSSVIIVFVHPSSRSAAVRSICGGHMLALGIGSACSFLFFTSPVADRLTAAPLLPEVGLAISIGALILSMALTDTEHPPAAGTVLALAVRPWNLETVIVIIAASAILATFRQLLGHRLKDLI